MPDPTNTIRGIRPTVIGAHATLGCRHCGHEFETYLPTVAGMSVGIHPCPRCNAETLVEPDDFHQAMERTLPPKSVSQMVRLTNEASRVTTGWHAVEPFASIVRHRGVNLGEAAERFLLSHVTQGILDAIASDEEPSE